MERDRGIGIKNGVFSAQEINQPLPQPNRLADLAFPKNKNLPALTAKTAMGRCITGFVAGKLGLPKSRSCYRHDTAFMTTMPVPKATMDHDDLTASREHQVRATRQRPDVEPVAVSKRMNSTANDQLGAGVFSTNSRHAVLSLAGC